jgi:hypothetical protein
MKDCKEGATIMKDQFEKFLDDDGKIKLWPAKRAVQRLIIGYLSEKFDFECVYSEKEVNTIIDKWHNFGDYFILRRGLIEEGFMKRTRDGSQYRRIEVMPPDDQPSSVP